MAPPQPELKKVRSFLPKHLFLSWELHPVQSGLSVPAPVLTVPFQYLDKRLFVQLNGSRKVIGVLRGYDVFLNIVLDEAVEEKEGGEKVRLGMVVIRGNSVVMLEALERIGGDDRPHR
ncbi:hypothetical protein QBC33DRAFT_456505 [Phialemonium atrogriseum]|uniref:Small nuclear ribonucleoprotein G n=1 Tax=Phialemonium atrogriseum TaxID=1093897 RepID=A0AAJ0BVG5_9PEZI|nr:uncharacterized protein QBC33DRAFT_456505 [Phialemonium atrogriseum]KAK1764732.1 hypothetical protein QBC33DRAFT_456505 [Phialemonium atrogriseum]